jgi:hypothetical protein
LLLKEGLPYDVLGKLDDDKVLIYYHIVMWMKEKEADAMREYR